MPFELIMLLGFSGAVLLSLLPPFPAKVEDKSFRGRRRHLGGERRGVGRHARSTERLTKRCRPVAQTRGAR